jgi:hypothetical protein
MINIYLRERACTESVRRSLIQGEFLSLSLSCSFYFGFEIILVLLCHFGLVYRFHAFYWA